MNLVDANVLLYAVNALEPRQPEAAGWLDAALAGPETVGFSWLVVLAFVRLSTRAGLYPHPLSPDQAVGQIQRWVQQPAGAVVEPTARHLDVLAGLLAETGAAGNLVSDAHLAALAVEHHATVITYDSDFGRFDGVRWRRPSIG